ncbi:MAG: amidase [Acidobacteriaceae bacterium]|jgi:Asp-tRNA(Asn)/Glu-tRNA(Gln) amidotransferase A subunit family amidase
MSLDRRQFLHSCGKLGFASTLLPGTLFSIAAKAESKRITAEMIDQAALIAGIPIEPDQKAAMLAALNTDLKGFEEFRALKMPNSVPPAFVFDPMPAGQEPTPPPAGADLRKPLHIGLAPAIANKEVPKDLNELAFCTVRELGELVRRRKVSSLDLTEMYLARLKKYDPVLHFVITLTEDRARAQAKEADKDLAAGKYRSILQGLPWGGKDLLAAKGYPTTWGAGGFEDQVFDYDATVVKRLDEAGAVLVAKLTLGALAGGDKWFGGRTRNPWNTVQGSSGSSAGPGSATASGCVAFSIGSETGGSISSPSTKCGVTGLRPTFGFVPRTGAMTLSWTMDKLGPMCRSAEDCALVMQAIWGPDGQDEACQKAWYQWNAEFDWKKLRIGYLKDDFEKPWEPPVVTLAEDATDEEKKAYERRKAQEPKQRVSREYDRQYDLAALEVLKNKMGVELIPVEIPKFPYDAMRTIYTTEGAAAFEEMTLSGRDKILYERSQSSYANSFRTAHFYPAVEYIQANRARTLAIQALAKVYEQVDIIVTPTSGSSNQVTVTNLTGQPAVIVPNGLRGADAPPAGAGFGGGGAAAAAFEAPAGPPDPGNQSGGPNTPVSITFLGTLYKDAEVLAFAHAYQEAAGFLKLHPPAYP